MYRVVHIIFCWRLPLGKIPRWRYAEDLAVITYNNHALLFRIKLSYLCVGHCAVHCSANALCYPQQEAK